LTSYPVNRPPTQENEPALFTLPEVESPKTETSELKLPATAPQQFPSPQSPSTSDVLPVQYLPEVADAAAEKGLQFYEDYGMARYVESVDFDSVFGYTGDASDSPGGSDEYDEFTQWCRELAY
jgi:hypothetical protein